MRNLKLTPSSNLILLGEPNNMKSNNTNYDDLDKYFYNSSSPRHLWTGESWWCHCSHEVSEHKTISKSPFIARCSGSDGSCPCKEFVAYRNISWEAKSKMNNKLLVDHAKKVQTLGFHPVPIAEGSEKKPPSWFHWTDLREGKRPALTHQEIESIFSSPEVVRVGIILNNRTVVIDYDGALGERMLWNEMIPSCSKELQGFLRSTAHTKTPHGGHILVILDSNAFPEGIEEIFCWQLIGNGFANGNAEIRILSQHKYSIEYGQGYEPIRDIQEIVTLSKRESTELVEICTRFKTESTAIRNISNSLLQYWAKGRRHDLALTIAGYLYKNKVTVGVARCLVLYMTHITNDEELQSRLDAVKFLTEFYWIVFS